MNRRDFIRSMFAAGVAVVAAPLMPKPGAPATLRAYLDNHGGTLQGMERVTYTWITDVNCPPDRVYAFYGSDRHPQAFGSLGPWFRTQ